MRFSLLRAARALILLALLSTATHAANVNDFQVYNYTDSGNNVVLPGRLFVPADYAANPNVARPLILFLHGSGESGTNNTAQVNGNIDNLFAAAKARGAFLYAPQTNVGWDSKSLLGDALAMIDRAIADRDVDPHRIYVTGLSMGGGGAWNFLNDFPDRVAATVPICAVPPSGTFDFAGLLGEPIWAHHGRFDSNVPATVTRDIINAFLGVAGIPAPTYTPLNKFGPDIDYKFPSINLQFSDYQASHDVWTRVYARPDLYDWMFAQGVPEPGAISLSSILVALVGIRVRDLRGTRLRRQ